MTDMHPTFYEIVPSVVRVVMRRFRGWVEPDDLKQECYKWAVAKSESFEEKLNEPNEAKRLHNEKNIAWQLKRVAERYARAPAESGNFLAILIDIKKAYQLLEVDDQKLLELRYHDSLTLQQISEYFEVSISTADRRCANAMTKLQENIGGENPFQ